MRGTIPERALEGLHDYLIHLRDRGDTSEGYAAKRNRHDRKRMGRAGVSKALKGYAVNGVSDSASQSRKGVVSWESRKLNSWRAEGRITEAGVLRALPGTPQPWTLARVAAAAREWTASSKNNNLTPSRLTKYNLRVTQAHA